MIYVVLCIAYSFVYYSNISFSRLITSVGEERAGIFIFIQKCLLNNPLCFNFVQIVEFLIGCQGDIKVRYWKIFGKSSYQKSHLG